jgi:DNA-binding transcriptional MerR regulator
MMELPPIPDKEFFSIGEVSQIAQIPSYVLRYWESEFALLRPARRASGQRKYIRNDIENVFQIKDLLYTRKFTIEGARKYLQGDKRKKDSHQFNLELQKPQQDNSGLIQDIRTELEDILRLLNKPSGSI